MTNEAIYEELAQAVINCKADIAKAAAEKALAEGINPVDAINEGLVKGMSAIGEKYAAHQIYLPQVLVAARALYSGLDILLPAIPSEALADSKKAATAVVEGDVHDIGKNIVKTMLTAGGFIVTDLGKDIPPADIAAAVKNDGIDVLCISTLMTPTMDAMKATVENLVENGSRGNCTVTIGGPPTSPSFAAEIGADHRDNNAQDCINWLKGQ
ncbi:MAG: cobalamin-dependent protein [Candidatus Methanomethylophilaceae archaeon]|nr:cobalamin-dependent protein [Candidatus Methanomethylophilaceae archaeon]